jgi:hypothetical protein
MSRALRFSVFVAAALSFFVLTTVARAQTPQAIVSDIDGLLTLGNNGTFSGVYDFATSTSADRPWYVVEVAGGEKMSFELYTDFPSTFLVYEVFDGNAEPGDTPFGINPDLQFIREADYPGSPYPRIYDIPVSHSTQLIVQIDSPNGSSGRCGLQSTRTLATPEPASLASIFLGAAVLLPFIRRRRIVDA